MFEQHEQFELHDCFHLYDPDSGADIVQWLMKNLSIEDPGKFPCMVINLTLTNKRVADIKDMDEHIAPFNADLNDISNYHSQCPSTNSAFNLYSGKTALGLN